jgi:uncharacterized protein YndB with AHSA1/START domain
MTKALEPASAETLPELRLSRRFAASRDRVFKAWSSAEHVRRWFCPAIFTVPEARVELRVGGAFDVCMRSPDGADHWGRGRFTEVQGGERLAFDMDVFAANGVHAVTSHTSVRFVDEAGGTRLDVVQTYTLHDPSGLPMIAGAKQGWSETLDRLTGEIDRMNREHAVQRFVAHDTFRIERLYAAPVARVWRALTDIDAKALWFGGPPGKWELIERVMDVRAGGRERLKGRWEGGAVTTFDAHYFDVVVNERLVYAYDMYQGEQKLSVSLATVELAAIDGKTRLTVTEQGAFLDGYDDAGSRKEGTGQLLDAIGASLDGETGDVMCGRPQDSDPPLPR